MLVVVAGDGRDGARPRVLASSVFPAVQNLLLAAASLGYGSAMTTLAAQAPDALAEIVGLPDGVRPMAVVPVGRALAALGPPRRRPLGEVAHLDAYGTPLRGHRRGGPSPPPRHPLLDRPPDEDVVVGGDEAVDSSLEQATRDGVARLVGLPEGHARPRRADWSSWCHPVASDHSGFPTAS